MPSPPQVLIVGAGPVGLTLATLLRRHGTPFRIVDQGTGPVRESRATDVHARTLELFSTIGLAEPLIALGRRALGASFYSGGRRIARVPVHELATPYPFILGVPQYETERLLLDDLARQGVAVERGVRFEGMDPDGDGVRVALRSGGRVEQARVGWLVGCDGANSAVRQGLGLPFEGTSYPEIFMLADARLDWELPADELHIFLSGEGFFQALPMPGERRVRLFVDVSGEQAELEPEREVFEALGRARAGLPLRVRSPGWMSKFRVHRRMVPRYRVGRVLLAGDAAHIHSPVGGQGMNTGIQDAWNLAWKLGLVVAHRAPESLLDTYHTERHAVARVTLLETHLATRMSQLKNPLLRELRDALAVSLGGIGAFSRWMAEVIGELRIQLPDSPIVTRDRASVLFADVLSDPLDERPSLAHWAEFGGAPDAGHRAPDRRFGGPGDARRFFSLLGGTRHLLLLFDGAKATPEGYKNLAGLAERVRARHGRVVEPLIVVPASERPAVLGGSHPVLLDPGGDLHCGFGARAECAYVVRPDGYIGYRAQPADAEAILAYLDRLLEARDPPRESRAESNPG
jgi:2-polyprenyl-6-methoxyphenol hydroxylase-like FAD-dependent oxidoreductase